MGEIYNDTRMRLNVYLKSFIEKHNKNKETHVLLIKSPPLCLNV